MNIVSLRDSDTLHSLPYLGAHLLVGKGSFLIHTANQKNVTLNLDFAKSVTNLPKTQKAFFLRQEKNRVIHSTQPNV